MKPDIQRKPQTILYEGRAIPGPMAAAQGERTRSSFPDGPCASDDGVTDWSLKTSGIASRIDARSRAMELAGRRRSDHSRRVRILLAVFEFLGPRGRRTSTRSDIARSEILTTLRNCEAASAEKNQRGRDDDARGEQGWT
jgi:hypothetical protein